MEDFNSKYTGEEVEEILDSVEGKQDAITDLASIREGAAKGATSVQPSDIKDVARKDSGYVIANGILDENDDYWHLPKNSLNDKEHTLASKSDIEEKILVIGDSSDEAKANFIAVANGEKTADTYVGSVDTQGYIVEGCVKLARSGSSSNLMHSFTIIGSPTVGQYVNKLIKVICRLVNGEISSEVNVIGTYSKPSTGIPKTDLENDVQNALNKAENAASKDKVGDMYVLPTQGFFGQSNGAVYALPNESTGDEDDILLSRDTVKTINGESILGSGNITISGGTDTKEIVEITGTSGIIEEFMPNKIYVHTSPTYNIDIWEYITTDAAVDEYITYFKTATTGLGGAWTPYYSFPDGTLWANGVYPETEPNTLYELSIVKTTINGVDYFKAVLTPFKPVE